MITACFQYGIPVWDPGTTQIIPIQGWNLDETVMKWATKCENCETFFLHHVEEWCHIRLLSDWLRVCVGNYKWTLFLQQVRGGFPEWLWIADKVDGSDIWLISWYGRYPIDSVLIDSRWCGISSINSMFHIQICHVTWLMTYFLDFIGSKPPPSNPLRNNPETRCNIEMTQEKRIAIS